MLDLTLVGLAVVLVGFALIVVAVVRAGGPRESGPKGAGILMVGPIPIIFGSDAKWVTVAVVLAIVLVLLSLLWYLI